MTTALRQQALAAARVAFLDSMTATATISRVTRVKDRSGGFTETWASVGTYSCSFSRFPIRPLERERDARIQAISYWAFRFPVGTVILNTDRIVVGARTFEVVSAGSGSTEITSQAVCQEIT